MKLQISEIEVQKLSAKPGDIVFFRFSPEDDITEKQLRAFRKQVRKLLPKGVKAVLVCSEDFRISKIEGVKDER